MANKLPLLDEQDFNQPMYLNDLPDQDINKANNFSWYFYSSQFNEPQSNNSAVLNVHKFDPQTYNVIHDRKEFESRVKGIPTGLQFVVAGEPQADGQPWLMQRQFKIVSEPEPEPEAEGEAEQEPEDRVDTYVEGNWYNQGTRILMAPSLLDVVRARLLTVSTRLQNIAELSQKMTHYSPAGGHSYYPTTFEAPKAAGGSAVGSPSLAPMVLDQPHETTTTAPVPEEPTDEFSDALFMTSLNLTNQYGDEYMDENPLKGEPGAFVFTNTRNAVDERNKAAEAALSLANAPKMLDIQPPSVAATPLPAATPAALESHSRKGSVAPDEKKKKKERRKSKGLASPTTPGPGIPPAA